MSDGTVTKETQGYEVSVRCRYIPEESNPEDRYFFFAYTVVITNVSGKAAKLLTRKWTITDGWGRIEEVKGPGVVGKFPRLEEGESFEYTSFCPLSTTTGTMEGVYRFATDDGEEFDVDIPQFFLYEPGSVN